MGSLLKKHTERFVFVQDYKQVIVCFVSVVQGMGSATTGLQRWRCPIVVAWLSLAFKMIHLNAGQSETSSVGPSLKMEIW